MQPGGLNDCSNEAGPSKRRIEQLPGDPTTIENDILQVPIIKRKIKVGNVVKDASIRNSRLSIGITTANWQPTRRKRKKKEEKLDPRGKYRYSQKREISQMDVRTRIRRHSILPSVPAAMPATKDRSPMSFQHLPIFLLLCSLIGRGQLAGFVWQFRL